MRERGSLGLSLFVRQPFFFRLLVSSAAVWALAGCAPTVGDACQTNVDCGTDLTCDTSQPEGYCTQRDCETNGCPDEGVCIRFPDDSRYCMKRCDSGSDCRDDYQCVKNYGDAPFCNASEYTSR